MRSAAFRATIGATAWIALGIAAFLVYRSEQRITQLSASLRAFDQHARDATTALAEARVAQQAYVAAGQGIGFWMPKVTYSTEAAQASLAALRESASAAAQTPLDQAAATTTEFTNIEKRVRDYLKSGQTLMAGDVIFTEGSDAAANGGRQVEAARQAEHQAFDVEEGAIRKLQAMTGAAAAVVAGLVVLLLVPVSRRAAVDENATAPLSIAPSGTIAYPAASTAAPSVSSTVDVTFKRAASLATDFGRVRDLDGLTRMLARAAEAMDASGVMVWIGSTGGGHLRPVLAHGYTAEVLARIPPVPRSADNAAAAAYRSGTLQIVLARPGKSSGAIVAPILSPDGCVGALSAEIRHGAETSEAVQALAEIAAAHLAGVLATTPAEISEPKTAQA
jgi:hypothetical protein